MFIYVYQAKEAAKLGYQTAILTAKTEPGDIKYSYMYGGGVTPSIRSRLQALFSDLINSENVLRHNRGMLYRS